MTENKKLQEWQEKFEKSKDKYSSDLQFYDDTNDQYEGKRKHIVAKDGKEPKTLYNMTKELIESQIDANIPSCKVDSGSMSERKRERATILEALIKSELKRLKFTELNDLDERIVKINSIDFALMEWDGLKKDGVVDIKLITPKQLIPQAGVYEIDDMDYLFLVFEDTKERIKERYGKDVSTESTDPESAGYLDTDNVTQIICFYLNEQRQIGCFSWVSGSTKVLVDDDNYNARGRQKCSNCGNVKIKGEKKCGCGGKWQKNNLEFEELTEDIVTSWENPDGTPVTIPAISPVIENGEIVMEGYEEPMTDYMGRPIYEQVFDEAMNPIGELPTAEILERPMMGATKIPYYVPKKFPVAMRKNISVAQKFRGDSDCETVWPLQDSMDKLLSKAEKRGINSGTIIAKIKDIKQNISNDEFAVFDVNTLPELNGIKPINIQFDTSQVEAQAMAKYEMAKSVLGITDTSQGKPDSTATSGVAKEIQVAQTQGRQQSKKVMKEAFYSRIFELIVSYYLAYSDAPITYTTTDEQGQEVEKVFNRYDFLDQDEEGNWKYDDDFIFTVDPTGSMFSSKQFQLEQARMNFQAGLYGQQQDPNAVLMWWKSQDDTYPNKKMMISYWQDIITKQEQQEQMMQQQLMAQQAQLGGGYPSSPPPIDGIGNIEI